MAPPSVLRLRTARVTGLHRLTPELFTLSCRLDDVESLAYQAGQWVYLHLLDADGQSLARGAFSLASSPSEGRPDLEFAIKIYGRLTATLSELKEGAVVGVQGPFGFFTLPSEPRPLLFLAGGIGVTPFRSLARAALDRADGQTVALAWIGKVREDLIYHREFEAWQAASDGRFVYRASLTRDPHPDWPGARGRLDAQLLDHLPVPWERVLAYVCGPQPFMDQAKALLALRGLEGRSRVREERFS